MRTSFATPLASTDARQRHTPRPRLRWVFAGGAAVAAAALSLLAVGQTAPPAFKLVDLASEPLYAKGAGQKPTLTLALSVEFPTVGAQYTAGGDTDASYSPANEYIGYFDAESCYAYVDATDASLRRFDRVGAATARGCGGNGFSGNFMNWATSSAIDILRFGLTGGDRIVDTAELTVLQRAVLRRNDFYNDTNFPAKRLSAALASGAVPSALLGTWTSDVWISNCLNRLHFGTQRQGNCNDPQNNANLGVAVPDGSGGSTLAYGTTRLAADRFFYARVKVCEASGAGALQDPRGPSYCQRYPAGNYKPIGRLQQYSDKVRVAAFGYLMDDTQARYGGVLRAPMKYVGPKSYDANGAPQASNAAIEWNPSTGVFVANPDSAAEGSSGVINYLNKFGRTGVEGQYKTYDPVGELYYEALRYVQGLPPTPQATAGMTDAMKNGFPVYTNWADPHAGGLPTRDHSCLKNNMVLIGDVNTHNDKSIPGNTTRLNDFEFARPANEAGNEPDFVHWTRVVGGFEANSAVSYLARGATTLSLTGNPNPAGVRAPRPALAGIDAYDTGATKAAYYLAGMAYWANTHDIRGAQWTSGDGPARQRPGMRLTTYILDVNEYGNQSNFDARHNSQFYLAGKYGRFTDHAGGVGNPYRAQDGSLDNSRWERTGSNGEPRGYFLSSSARDVLAALDEIFREIGDAGNSIAGGAISSQQVSSDGGHIYQARFDPARWSGDVRALPVRLDNGLISVNTLSPTWSAAARLDQPAVTPASRKLFVGKVDRATANATPFTWAGIESAPGAPGTRLREQLDRPAPGEAADGLGQQRLDFLRGDRSLEGSAFRPRSSRLGDIVNSGVVYSGAPAQRFHSDAYRQFHGTYKNRTKALFVGANDGMLHAFDAQTGDELFGYIPSWLGAQLAALTSPTYNTALHRSFVDATPRVAEAEYQSGGTSTWKTVLVGGTGAGGQGVYALDVSDPSAFDESKVLWEFTDRDDPALGNVLGRPQILKMRTSAPGAATATYRSYVVVASGVNNTLADAYPNTSANPSGHSNGLPALFLLDLSKPAGDAWVLGSNYHRISVPVNATLAATVAPGVIEFRASPGMDGEVEFLYFGDLHGNLWKLDFAANGKDKWNMADLSAFKNGATPVPMFVARDAASRVQPISMPPTLISGPNRSVIVSFGTGKYLESADNELSTATQVQSVYALYDGRDSDELDTAGGGSAIAGRGRLAAGAIDTATGKVSMPPFAWGRATSDSDGTQRSGWYFDFASRGERQISGAGAVGTTLIFGSLIPPDVARDACGIGNGYQYLVDLATGDGDALRSSVGLLGEPFVVQAGDAAYSATDSAGRRTKTVKSQVIVQGAGDIKRIELAGGQQEIRHDSVVGRLSWRRIANYQELVRQ